MRKTNMLPPANEVPGQMKWTKEQWIERINPYIEEMADHTEETIDAVVGRRMGIQVYHLNLPAFVEAWMELELPFTKMIVKNWNMMLNSVVSNFDGQGFSKEEASDQFFLIFGSKIGSDLIQNKKFCGNFLLHHPEEFNRVPENLKIEMFELLSTGVEATKVKTLSAELLIAENASEERKKTIEKYKVMFDEQEAGWDSSIEEGIETYYIIAKTMQDFKKLKKELKDTKRDLERAKKELADTKRDHERAKVNVFQFMTGLIHPPAVTAPAIQEMVQSTIRAEVPTAPANLPPTNRRYSWNFSYASQGRNNPGPPIVDNENGRGHQQHQGNRHQHHGRQQHQGRGYQKRYRDNNGNYQESCGGGQG
jgi:hypothetical protein